MSSKKVSVFWFRRDIRLDNNHGLSKALKGDFPVLPLFIFDKEILNELPSDDPRATFIHDQISEISKGLKNNSSDLYCCHDTPLLSWKKLLTEYDIQQVYANEDYEPYALERDLQIKALLANNNISFDLFKDQIIFHKKEIVKQDNTSYTVFTPYKNKWLSKFDSTKDLTYYTCNENNYFKFSKKIPSLEELGFTKSSQQVKPFTLDYLENYDRNRNFPALDQTSYLSPHLRFGTISIRLLVQKVIENPVFLSELIWREFFMQILYSFPKVVSENFRSKYNYIEWRNDPKEFELWKRGMTGYPMVDAGMRQLNQTGYMHNRVRMVCASFLCKHLLIDWRWGEAYFAEKLLDYELASNNGNWQWSAGTGCDAAPYFRVFNPSEQIKKFDPKLIYCKKWVPELNSFDYPSPMVEHKSARLRALRIYKEGIEKAVI